MDDVTTQVARMLERAQAGEDQQVLVDAERILRARTGDLLDGDAAMHFVRAVAIISGGDTRASVAAAELMLMAADREDSNGWRSCALSLRAHARLWLAQSDATVHALETVLRDLVAAEVALEQGVDDPWLASNAHTGIALPYQDLRLYELAEPHYAAAYDLIRTTDGAGDAPTMWLLNLTSLHLVWALDLYRVGDPLEAEAHSRQALAHAEQAASEARGSEAASWRKVAALLAASARISLGESQPALQQIEDLAPDPAIRAFDPEGIRTAPFRAVALARVGRRDDGLAVLAAALQHVNEQSVWIDVATLQHTQAQLLVAGGSPDAAIVMQYGQTLADALWRQRLRTLHVARTMRSFDTLQAQHAVAEQSALTDPLTGIANRRAFDAEVARLRDDEDPDRSVAVLVVDLDDFKQVNDTRGHDAGDEVLVKVAAALAANVREGDLVARLGGDEFAALLPGTGVEPGLHAAMRMLHAVDLIEDCEVTASIGVTAGPAWQVDGARLAADRAMYVAKRAGGNRISTG